MKKIALVLSLALIMIFVSSCSAITSAHSPKGSYVDFSMSDIKFQFDRRINSYNSVHCVHVLTNKTKYPIVSYNAIYEVASNESSQNKTIDIANGSKITVDSKDLFNYDKFGVDVKKIYNTNDSVICETKFVNNALKYWSVDLDTNGIIDEVEIESGSRTYRNYVYLSLDQMDEIVNNAKLSYITIIFSIEDDDLNDVEHSYTYYADTNEIIENY